MYDLKLWLEYLAKSDMHIHFIKQMLEYIDRGDWPEWNEKIIIKEYLVCYNKQYIFSCLGLCIFAQYFWRKWICLT